MKFIFKGGTPMSKLNALGLELLDLKTAIATDYPEVVQRSLSHTANEMLKNELIDQETHYLLTEPVFAWEDFKTFCLGKSAYCKSEEELLSLYEEKRTRLEEALQRCIEQQQISVVNYLKDEQIMVVKAYRFGAKEVQAYFGIEKIEDCEALMGRKRFIERFIALRYPKIIKEFIHKNSRPGGFFQLGHSSVYFDEETEEYVIELLFKIKIETFEEVEVTIFERPIIKMIERCNRWFGDYLGIDGHFYQSSNKPTQAAPKQQVVEQKIQITPQPKPEQPKTEQPIVSASFNREPVNEIKGVEESETDNISLLTMDEGSFVIEEPTLDETFEVDLDLPEVHFEIDPAPIVFNSEDIL